MSLLSFGPAIVAPVCACMTLLPGYTTRERVLAFSANAVVLACTLAVICRG